MPSWTKAAGPGTGGIRALSERIAPSVAGLALVDVDTAAHPIAPIASRTRSAVHVRPLKGASRMGVTTSVAVRARTSAPATRDTVSVVADWTGSARSAAGRVGADRQRVTAAVAREAFVDVMAADFAIAGVALRASTANSLLGAVWHTGYERVTPTIGRGTGVGAGRRPAAPQRHRDCHNECPGAWRPKQWDSTGRRTRANRLHRRASSPRPSCVKSGVLQQPHSRSGTN